MKNLFLIILSIVNFTLYSQDFTPVYSTPHLFDITCLSKIPGQKLVATSSVDNTIKIWTDDLQNQISTFQLHNSAVKCIVSSNDGKYILSADKAGLILFWNIDKLERKGDYVIKKGITSIDLASNNVNCVVADVDGSVIFLDIVNSKELAVVKSAGIGARLSDQINYTWVRFSIDNKFIYLTNENKINVYDIEKKEIVKKIKTGIANVISICPSPDGKFLFAGTMDGLLLKIDCSTYEIISSIPNHTSAIASICFSNDNKEMLVGCVDSWFYTYDVTLFSQIRRFKNIGGGTLFATYNDDNKSVYCTGGDKFYRLNSSNGDELASIQSMPSENIRDVLFNTSGSMISFLRGGVYHDFNLSNLVMNKTLRTEAPISNHLLASPDRNLYVVQVPGSERKERFFKTEADRLTNTDWQFYTFFEVGNKKSTDDKEIFRKSSAKFNCWYYKPLCFSTDNSKLISGMNGNLYLYDLKQGQPSLIDSASIGKGKAVLAKFSPSVNIFTSISSSGVISVWDLTTYNPQIVNGNKYGSLKAKLNISTNNLHAASICISPDNLKIALFDLQNGISAFSMTDGTQLFNVPYKGGNPSKMYFTPDNKQIVILFPSGSISFIDANTGKPVFDILFLNEDDWMITSPDNFYFASKNSNSKIKFKSGNKFYPVEQFELKFNRPDLVLAKTGHGSLKAIELYKLQFNKRLKSAGIKETDLLSTQQLPVSKIISDVPINSTQGEVSLTIELSDSLHQLNKLFVIVNGMSLYGSSGLDISVLKLKKLEKMVNIPLLSGSNSILYYVINSSGLASLRKVVKINYKPIKPVKTALYIISIGVSEYKTKSFNLNYAAKDANDILKFYVSHKLYDTIITKSLTNTEVTKKNIVLLKEFTKGIKPGDVVVFFIAGHGILDKNFNYYFGSFDIDFNNPSLLGIAFKDLEDLLSSISAYRKFLIMDTCHSGEIDKDDVASSDEQTTKSENVSFRDAGNVAIKNKTGLSQSDLDFLTNDMFSDLRLSTGTTIIASAGGAEYAMESAQWKNGLFTYCLLHGMKDKSADLNKDGEIMLSELRTYLNEEVIRMSGGKQRPTTRAFNKESDFRVW